MADCNTIPFTIAGILIGAAGGSLSTFFIGRKLNKNKDKKDSEAVYDWLNANTSSGTYIWRKTIAIAEGTNLTEARVRDICSTHPKIRQSLGPNKDLWGIRELVDKES